MAADTGVDLGQVPGTGKDGRVTKGDIQTYGSGAGATSAGPAKPAPTAAPAPAYPAYKDKAGDRRVPMSNLRARIAERLVQAQHTAAILTTFNEVDMSAVNALRAKHKETFKAKHGVGLGFMSFFTRACVEAFKVVPEVNASIDGKDVIYHDYVEMGIAVGSGAAGSSCRSSRAPRRWASSISRRRSAEFATKAKDGKLSIAPRSGARAGPSPSPTALAPTAL